MALNIIVRSSKRQPQWNKVVEIVRGRRDARLQDWSRRGSGQLAKRSQTVISGLRDSERANIFVVDRQTDGRLMDICRHLKGHTDWRRDADFLKFATKCDDFSGVFEPQRAQIERMISEAKDAILTPAYSVEKHTEERRQSDLAKLPAHYRQGATK